MNNNAKGISKMNLQENHPFPSSREKVDPLHRVIRGGWENLCQAPVPPPIFRTFPADGVQDDAGDKSVGAGSRHRTKKTGLRGPCISCKAPAAPFAETTMATKARARGWNLAEKRLSPSNVNWPHQSIRRHRRETSSRSGVHRAEPATFVQLLPPLLSTGILLFVRALHRFLVSSTK